MHHKHLAFWLIGIGAVIFAGDAFMTAQGKAPIFLNGTTGSGILSGVQSFIPIPLDLGLMGAGAALLIF